MDEKNEHIERLEELLSKIGWSVRGRYPNRYIFNHEAKNTRLRVMYDRIEPSLDDGTSCVIQFGFKGSKIGMVENDAVAIGTDECFILCMNHGLAKASADAPTPIHK